MSARLRFVVMAGIICFYSIAPINSQTRPSLSGTWVFVSESGGGRGGGTSGPSEPRTRASFISSAPANCGNECTVDQDTQTLTLVRTEADQKAHRVPNLVVNLDGSETQSQPPYRDKAKWDDARLVITRPIVGPLSVTQTLSIEDGKLRIVTKFSEENMGPTVQTYQRK
jgi:hypothetical protein